MSEQNKKEQMMRAYWLGALIAEQVEVFETTWFGNDEDAELLEIIRADLIDEYLTKSLTASERKRFEENFLPANLEDVVLTKSSLEISREQIASAKSKTIADVFLGALRGFYGIPRIAAAAAVLLLCFGLWFKFSGSGSFDETARKVDPIEAPQNEIRRNTESPAVSDGNVAAQNRTAENKEKITNADTNKIPGTLSNRSPNRISPAAKKPTAEKTIGEKRQILFLAVFRGSPKTVKFAGGQTILTIKLTMPGIDREYDNYRLKISDQDGNVVVSRYLGGGLSFKKSGETLTVPFVRGSLFRKNNTYNAVLVGVDETGAETDLITYQSFKVE